MSFADRPSYRTAAPMTDFDARALAASLAEILGSDRVLHGPEARRRHPGDMSWLTYVHAQHGRPLNGQDVVASPRSTREVADVLKLAARLKVPVTPAGGASGVQGAANATCGGILLDLRSMTRVRNLDRRSLTCTVEAGMIVKTFEEQLERPGAELHALSGIGGMGEHRRLRRGQGLRRAFDQVRHDPGSRAVGRGGAVRRGRRPVARAAPTRRRAGADPAVRRKRRHARRRHRGHGAAPSSSGAPEVRGVPLRRSRARDRGRPAHHDERRASRRDAPVRQGGCDPQPGARGDGGARRRDDDRHVRRRPPDAGGRRGGGLPRHLRRRGRPRAPGRHRRVVVGQALRLLSTRRTRPSCRRSGARWTWRRTSRASRPSTGT